MPTFRSLHDPNFKLWSIDTGAIAFKKGEFSTDHPAAVAALRRNQNVEEVTDVALGSLTRPELNVRASKAGVPNPGGLPTKQAVAKAIETADANGGS